MRVAALYDIHGNLPALEAVLEEDPPIARRPCVVGGDVVPGPMPRETLEVLLDLDMPVQFIRGQRRPRGARHRCAASRPAAVPEAFREVDPLVGAAAPPEHEALLARWPVTLRLRDPRTWATCCSATPRRGTTRRSSRA